MTNKSTTEGVKFSQVDFVSNVTKDENFRFTSLDTLKISAKRHAAALAQLKIPALQNAPVVAKPGLSEGAATVFSQRTAEASPQHILQSDIAKDTTSYIYKPPEGTILKEMSVFVKFGESPRVVVRFYEDQCNGIGYWELLNGRYEFRTPNGEPIRSEQLQGTAAFVLLENAGMFKTTTAKLWTVAGKIVEMTQK